MKNITVKELKEKIDNKENFILLDVRYIDEYDQGNIKKSILIPYDELEERYEEINAKKDSTIIVYCRSGKRSKKAAKILDKLGYTHVINVLGGIAEWEENGYPVSG